MAASAGKTGKAVNVSRIFVDGVRTCGEPVTIVFTPFTIRMVERLGRHGDNKKKGGGKACRVAH